MFEMQSCTQTPFVAKLKRMSKRVFIGFLGFIAVVAATVMNCSLASAQISGTSISSTSTFLGTSTTHSPIVITKNADWEFGVLFTGSTAGTATVGTNGALSSTGGVTPMSTSLVTPAAAAFKITGDVSSVYSVVFPTSMTLTRVGGTQTMTLDGFVKTGTGVLATGSESIKIGATLHLGALQPAGRYTGTNYVTVVYN